MSSVWGSIIVFEATFNKIFVSCPEDSQYEGSLRQPDILFSESFSI